MDNKLGFFEGKVQTFKDKYDDMHRKISNFRLKDQYEILLGKLNNLKCNLDIIESMDEFILQCKVSIVPDKNYKKIIAEMDGFIVNGNAEEIARLEDIINRISTVLYEQKLIRANKCNIYLEHLFNDKKGILDCFNQTNNLLELNKKENEIKAMGIKKETIAKINEYSEEKNKLFASLGIGHEIAEILLKLNTGTAGLDDISGENIKKWFTENEAGKQIENRIRLQLR